MNVQVQPHVTTTQRHLPFDVWPVRRRLDRRIPIERQPGEKVTRLLCQELCPACWSGGFGRCIITAIAKRRAPITV
jgi:hypothetical protein